MDECISFGKHVHRNPCHVECRGGLVWPWQYAAFVHDPTGFLTGMRECIFNHAFWYIFLWLLPLGLVRLRLLPRPWVLATVLAFCGALALGAYNNAGGDTSRALFSVAGPILSLSATVFLTGTQRAKEGENGLTGMIERR